MLFYSVIMVGCAKDTREHQLGAFVTRDLGETIRVFGCPTAISRIAAPGFFILIAGKTYGVVALVA